MIIASGLSFLGPGIPVLDRVRCDPSGLAQEMRHKLRVDLARGSVLGQEGQLGVGASGGA